MTELVLIATFVGTLQITSYRSVPAQTDDSPNYTSIGEHCNVNGVALSRDLLKRWGGQVAYGDMLYIDGIGWRKVNDCMAQRHKKHVDIWVQSYDDEKAFDLKWHGKKTKVWVVKRLNKKDK